MRTVRLSNVVAILAPLLMQAGAAAGQTPAEGQLPSMQTRSQVAATLLTTEDGLSSSSPNALLQDSKGFIWISTLEGLNRYDGKEFVTFYHDPSDPNSLSASGIGRIHEGPNGHIWGISDEEFNELDPVTGRVVRHKTDEESPDGLSRPAGSPNSFLNTSDGSLWLFTRQGLARREPGSDRFTFFKHDSTNVKSLASDLVFSAMEGPSGILWVLTGSPGSADFKLSRIRLADNDVARLPELISGPDSLGAYSVSGWQTGSATFSWIADARDRFWVGVHHPDNTWGAVLRYDADSDTFERFDLPVDQSPSLFRHWPGDFFEFSDGRLGVVLMTGGMMIFENEGNDFEVLSVQMPAGRDLFFWVSPMLEPDGSVLMTLTEMDSSTGEESGVLLGRYDPSTGRVEILEVDENDPGRPNRAQTLSTANIVDPAGFFWLEDLTGGLTRYDPVSKTFRDFDERDGVPFARGLRSTGDFLTDGTNEFWMGQPQVGIVRISSKKRPLDLISATLPGDPLNFTPRVVWAMHVDPGGTFWVGSDLGLHRWDPEGSRFELYRDGYRTERTFFGDIAVNLIMNQNDGSLLLGSSIGLFTFDPRRPAFVPFAFNGIDEAAPRVIYDVHPVGGDTLLASTSGGVFLLNRDGDKLNELSMTADGDSTEIEFAGRTLFETDDGEIWVGLNDGLARLDLASSSIHRVSDSLWAGVEIGRVSSIVQDATDPDILWIGTRGTGLVKFHRREGFFAMYLVSNSDIPNNFVESILPDEQSRLWLSTNRGLARFSPDDESFVVFGMDDGLQSMEFVWQSAAKTDDGTMMFGGLEGINLVHPGDLQLDSTAPVIALTRLGIFNPASDKSREYFGVDPDDPAMTRLTHNENDLTFSFAGLHFAAPEDNRYMYRLEGYEPSFSEPSTTNTVRYSNLSHGNYVFRVEASNSDGVWTEDGYSFAFTIRPPWWRTIWAYMGYVLLLGAGIWTVDRTQRARIERRERETARIERAELEAKAAASEAAVLKAENELKETELIKAKELEYAFNALQEAHDDLKATQDQLIHAEKMASLGALTAGIAHEIKNPLNFINNFAEINAELAADILDALPDSDEARQVREMLTDLRQNSDVIGKHGRRADSIVQNMLQHARGGAGEKEDVDLNRMVGEYIDLAYHGKRSQVDGFNVDIERDLADGVGSVRVVPQDIGRVLLNLIGNAFDAVQERAAAEDGFAPHVSVETRRADAAVEIRVTDNGGGIAAEHLEEIFKPFFTTKPTGSGTGLGLSMSYDTVTKGHGGTLTAESTPGQGASFTVTLPR